MAAAGTNVSNFDGLNFSIYVGHGIATGTGAQTQAHGITAFTPDVALVIQTAGHNGMGAAGTQLAAITAISVNATNVLWTSDAAGGTSTIVAF